MLLEVHENRVLEEVAIQHRVDKDVADHDRWNRQQDQGQRDYPGRLVRLGVVAMRIVSVAVSIRLGVSLVCVCVVVTMRVMLRVSCGACMIIMTMTVRIRVLVVALFSVEHQEIHAERIESGDEHTCHDGEVRETSSRQMTLAHRFDDAVLRIEAREKRYCNQSERTQERGDPGDGHVLAHAAHPADVLVVMHAHDDRARSEEQQRLEERVGHQVEHSHRIRRCTQCHGHVAQLGQRGIRDDSLDVVLDDAEETHEERGNAADDHDETQSRIAQLEQR